MRPRNVRHPRIRALGPNPRREIRNHIAVEIWEPASRRIRDDLPSRAHDCVSVCVLQAVEGVCRHSAAAGSLNEGVPLVLVRRCLVESTRRSEAGLEDGGADVGGERGLEG